MKRSTAAFFLVWNIAFGAWSTKNFAQNHGSLDLACALANFACAVFYAHQLWREP